MKKSEKLLDAIGQIDDRLVEEAAKAGALQGAGTRRRKKRAAVYRLQGALAACAMLLVCVGIVSLLQNNAISPQNSGSAEIMEEAAMDSAGGEAGAAPAEYDGAAPFVQSGEGAEADGDARAEAENDAGVRMDSGEKSGEGAAPDAAALSDEGMETGAHAEEDAKSGKNVQTDLQEEKSMEEAKLNAESAQQPESRNGIAGHVLESSVLTVTYTVTNAGTKDIVLKEEYTLERLEGDAWQAVDPVCEVCWKEDGILVEAGDFREITSSLELIYGELPSGQYRLVRYYLLAAGKEPEGMEVYPLYLEFSVDREK